MEITTWNSLNFIKKSTSLLFSGVTLLKLEHFHLEQAEGNSFKIRELVNKTSWGGVIPGEKQLDILAFFLSSPCEAWLLEF